MITFGVKCGIQPLQLACKPALNMHFKCVCGHSDLGCYYGHRDLNTPKKITKAEGHCSDSTPTHMNNK